MLAMVYGQITILAMVYGQIIVLALLCLQITVLAQEMVQWMMISTLVLVNGTRKEESFLK